MMRSLFYPIISTVFGHYLKEMVTFRLGKRLIKSEFSRRCPEKYKQYRSASRLSKGEQAIWQHRFWEHQIRDDTDFIQHVDYIHYNPVKHGLADTPPAETTSTLFIQ